MKYCSKCGSKLDNATGRCPKCDPPAPKNVKNKSKKGAGLKIFVIILVILILAAAVLFVLWHFGIIGKDKSKNEKDDSAQSSYYVPLPDANEYYHNNSTVIDEINAAASADTHTESEAYTNITDRGFQDFPITTNYTMSGDYIDELEISADSSDMHPMYQTFYVTSEGNVWTIFEINGAVMANPVFYNEQSAYDVQLIISESESVVSYDSVSNKFYNTIPDESALIVKTVSRIDAETLEGLTIGAIDGL